MELERPWQLEFIGHSTGEKRAAQRGKPRDLTEDRSWSILQSADQCMHVRRLRKRTT